MRRTGQALAGQLVWLAILALFIVVGLRLLGLAL